MTALRRLDMRAGMMGWAALILFASAGPARAGSLILGAIPESGRISHLYPVTTGTLTQGTFDSTPILVVSNDLRVDTIADAALKFDISSIPQGATIDSATFTFHVAGTEQVIDNPKLQVWGGAGSNSGVISLSDFPPPGVFPLPIATIAPPQIPLNAFPGSVDIPFSIDVTSIIQSLTTSSTPFAVFGFEEPTTANMAIWGIGSGNDPVLTVISPSVPEPPGALLLGLGLVLQRHVRQLSMAQVIIFQELKSFLRISIRTWLMDQNPCETSRFLAIGVLTQRCSTRGSTGCGLASSRDHRGDPVARVTRIEKRPGSSRSC